MNCPRCGANNKDDRASCWNCFAQLHQPEAKIKDKKEKPKKEKPVVAKPETEPEPEPETEPIMATELSSEEAAQEIPEVEPEFEDLTSTAVETEETDSAETEPSNDIFAVPGLVETFGVIEDEDQETEDSPLSMQEVEEDTAETDEGLNFEAEAIDLDEESDESSSEQGFYIPGLSEPSSDEDFQIGEASEESDEEENK